MTRGEEQDERKRALPIAARVSAEQVAGQEHRLADVHAALLQLVQRVGLLYRIRARKLTSTE